MADGQRLLMLQATEQPQSAPLTQINVGLNWFEELRRKAPVTSDKPIRAAIKHPGLPKTVMERPRKLRQGTSGPVL